MRRPARRRLTARTLPPEVVELVLSRLDRDSKAMLRLAARGARTFVNARVRAVRVRDANAASALGGALRAAHRAGAALPFPALSALELDASVAAFVVAEVIARLHALPALTALTVTARSHEAPAPLAELCAAIARYLPKAAPALQELRVDCGKSNMQLTAAVRAAAARLPALRTFECAYEDLGPVTHAPPPLQRVKPWSFMQLQARRRGRTWALQGGWLLRLLHTASARPALVPTASPHPSPPFRSCT